MSPFGIASIVAAGSLAAAGFLGWLVLQKTERIGELKVELRDKQAIIDQKNKDADLSEKLVGLQTFIESRLKNIGTVTQRAITNATTDDDAARATRDGILQLKSAPVGPGSTSR